MRNDFNPRSREGATSIVDKPHLYMPISIHAPAKERLNLSFRHLPSASNFNPRSREGATKINNHILISLIFQSTLPRRSDLQYSLYALFCFYFNPRSREGATLVMVNSLLIHQISIHAPAKERLDLVRPRISEALFQSTLPRRSDYGVYLMLSYQGISIHAPAKERRKFRVRCDYWWCISIHAPAKERRW